MKMRLMFTHAHCRKVKSVSLRAPLFVQRLERITT